jgi:4-alpha-glucanotransferase
MELARAAGLTTEWRDVFGETHIVRPDTLRSVLAALGLPAATQAQIADSMATLTADAEYVPSLITAQVGGSVRLPKGRFRLKRADGTVVEGKGEDGLPPIHTPGYLAVELQDRQITLAVAPARCFGLQDVAPHQRLWGLAVQLYSLRRAGDGGIGDFHALRQFVGAAARHGAAAVAISPVHAQFSADPDRFSPYAPSSRALFNAVHVDPGDLPHSPLEAAPLVDWPRATRDRLARLRRAWLVARTNEEERGQLERYRAARGDLLEAHARFETLHAHIFGADRTRWHWRDWPAEYRDPSSAAVAAFATEHADEVAFHAWLQFRAERELEQAQATARQAGMPIGVIADMAVGADSGGSHCWSRQGETLAGLSIGAPPDLLGPQGQNWGLAAFSPHGLVRHGYAAFLEMLRASLRHAGGVRIDHVMGLSRLWVIPEGATPMDGTYLRFPTDDLLRLVALESWRHHAIVLGEDLGTVPDGFRQRLIEAGLLGLRVLWFERDGDTFRPPRSWTPEAVAMTSTHDLATVAGWWGGRDLQWREKLGLSQDPASDRALRARDRALLWQAFRDSGAALHNAPPPSEGHHAAGSAAVHVGKSACAFALLPVEDALALEEQPNLPGTLHEHPNWQRRLPAPAASVLDAPDVTGRLAALNTARSE